MNIKAERIDQLIQIINRNLILVYSGQYEGLTEIDSKRLQRVDAIVFGHDKFAYEMVHFVRSSIEKLTGDDSLFSKWESTFVRGLESLLVECSVVHDDIERDCFISRVYCWFTEKLLERREVPRDDHVSLADLRSSVVRLGGDNTYSKVGLEQYERTGNHRDMLMNTSDILPKSAGADQTTGNDIILPNITDDNNRATVNQAKKIQRLPVYVKHNYPVIFKSKEQAEYDSFLPKVKNGAANNDNYGLLYNKPETEAEKKMNELWLARRRQEAFEFKTQQQLALVMDRLALHKARMESDALRRQESSSMLKAFNVMRPKSANAAIKPTTQSGNHEHNGLVSSMSPQPHKPSNEMRSNVTTTEPSRCRSIAEKMNTALYDNMRSERSRSPSPGHRTRNKSPDRSDSRSVVTGGSVEGTTNITITGNGFERETRISKASRTMVAKSKDSSNAKSGLLPMRFKMDLPDGYSNERNQYYMQLSDSDDEDMDESRNNTGSRSQRTQSVAANAMNTAAGNATTPAATTEVKKKKPANNKIEAPMFKHDIPVVRERPVSAKLFHQISVNDPEFKVHYRHTNYRRMPMTEEQQHWVEERQIERTKKSEEVAKALVTAQQAKTDKKKGKDAKDKGKDKDKDKGKKGGKKGGAAAGGKATTGATGAPVVISKYKSAQHFMDVNFPQFEADDDIATMGPMRALQMMEVANVLEACDTYRVPVKESAVRRALVIPQDRPEAICMEELRDEKEGLMINPNPQEFWRKFSAGGKGGKGGKKKKKK